MAWLVPSLLQPLASSSPFRLSMATNSETPDHSSIVVNDFIHRDGFPALRFPTRSEEEVPAATPSSSCWNIDADEPIPRYAFGGSPDALSFVSLDKLRHDCETVFSARAKDDQEAYSAGVTYFCPALMPPRCALEALALDIFRMHTQHLEEGVMIMEQSGAEWWTLVLDDDQRANPTNHKDEHDQDDDDDEVGSDEVGLHFDADYGLEDQAAGLLLHPRLATVTYLSDYGAPTVVFDKKSPPTTDPHKKTLQGDIAKGWLSRPATGKHICFDGRLLHGAPATFFPAVAPATPQPTDEPPTKRAKSEASRIRYTFLVNIWINHCPLDAEPLEEEICEQLTPVPPKDQPLYRWSDSLSTQLSKPLECSVVQVAKHSVETEPAGEEEFILCRRLVTCLYNAAMEDLHALAASAGDFVELQIEPGAISLLVGDEVASDNEEESHSDGSEGTEEEES